MSEPSSPSQCGKLSQRSLGTSSLPRSRQESVFRTEALSPLTAGGRVEGLVPMCRRADAAPLPQLGDVAGGAVDGLVVAGYTRGFDSRLSAVALCLRGCRQPVFPGPRSKAWSSADSPRPTGRPSGGQYGRSGRGPRRRSRGPRRDGGRLSRRRKGSFRRRRRWPFCRQR